MGSTSSSPATATSPAARPGPRRCSKASSCCRSASSTRIPPSAGRVIPLSSAEVVDAPAPEADEQREAILARFTTELGDAVVGSHIRPGNDLWIRVTREAWRAVGELARQRLGCAFFDFLSAIDWLPSPYGRELDAEVDNPVTK